MTDATKKIKEWNKEYGFNPDCDILLIFRLRESGFGDESIATVLRILESICNECWDAGKGENYGSRNNAKVSAIE